MTTFALAIPHTPWIPERVASLRRLKGQLGIDASCISYASATNFSHHHGEPTHGYREFRDREPNRAWSEKLWAWGLDTGAEYMVQLQDDVIVAPEFWTHLHAMVATWPDRIIGLESVHDMAPRVLEDGSHWYTTADMLIGVGYVIPRGTLALFLDWRRHLVDGWECHEDTLLGVYCLATGTRIWHPVPTVIDHDVGLASTYGNDAHTHRRPTRTLARGGSCDGWPRAQHTPHLGRFYSHTPQLARRIVRDVTREHYSRMVDDVWRGEYR